MERMVKDLTEKELRDIIREEVAKALAPTVTISGIGAQLYEPRRAKVEPILPEIFCEKGETC